MGKAQRNDMRIAAMALIVGTMLFLSMVDQAKAQPVGGVAEKKRPVVFLGNESLPPKNFMKDGRPTGIVIDLVEALAKRMHQPVEIRLMNWTEAQKLVLEGRADALLQIDPNPERLKTYNFSEPLLITEFTIFTSAQRFGVDSIRDLRGLKVGVEEKGLPILLLQKDPQVIVEIIPDFVQGFRMLVSGTVDAVVADRWVGSYVLAENNIRDVKMIEEPISLSHSAIAVKKGNMTLLEEINAALKDIRRDGTYDRIIKSWQPAEVVFKTREQLRRQTWLITAISAALITALMSVAALVREIFRRKRVEVTLRKSDELIQASLREKEMLLQEIHHRVKNNLQIISSLLNLQANFIEDEKVEGIFLECQYRIAAMASVHAQLYKSQNFTSINFADYVQETANQLFRAYNTSATTISLVIQTDEIILPIDTAIPCGLLLNELITNALKYAFPGARKGEIRIEMQQTEKGVRLVFKDNGIGFPGDVDFHATQTFGLKLVHMLVKQLDGSIEQFSNGGTRYVIVFKEQHHKETGNV